MLIGYARVSTDDQHLDLQGDALAKAGCECVFKDAASSAKSERTGLTALLATLRQGGRVVNWRLDRLGRSLKDLIFPVERLDADGVEPVQLAGERRHGIDRRPPRVPPVRRAGGVRAQSYPRALPRRHIGGPRAATRAGARSGSIRSASNSRSVSCSYFEQESASIASTDRFECKWLQLADGAPLDDATFRFHSKELVGMLHAARIGAPERLRKLSE